MECRPLRPSRGGLCWRKHSGLEIPPQLLALADEVIEYPLPEFAATHGAAYGQTSLLVGHRSSAKRRWIKAYRAAELVSLAGHRYSGCGVGAFFLLVTQKL